MSKKAKIFNVYCEVYGCNLLVVVGMKKEKLRPYLENRFKIKWEYLNDDLRAGGVLKFSSWPYTVLWLKDNLGKKDLMPKLSHEILHVVLRICADKQIPTYPEIDGLIVDEAAGYLMEFYMREILKKL